MKSDLNDKRASDIEISKDRIRLRNPYAHLDANGNLRALKTIHLKATNNEIATSRILLGNQYAHIDDVGGFSAITRKKEKYSKEEIENKVKAIHRVIWQSRDNRLPQSSNSYVEMLDPIKAFELLGYSCSIESSLGEMHENGKLIEAAGLIDNDSRQVRISKNFKPDVRRFTAAHELGHALLHTQNGLHRDRPVDGSSKAKEISEYEADFFASRFLMPEKLLKNIFKRMFLTENFVLTEDTASAFRLISYSELKFKCKTARQFSRFLASVEQYNGVRFDSLASQFKVSVEAMAIRLEELKLFNY